MRDIGDGEGAPPRRSVVRQRASSIWGDALYPHDAGDPTAAQVVGRPGMSVHCKRTWQALWPAQIDSSIRSQLQRPTHRATLPPRRLGHPTSWPGGSTGDGGLIARIASSQTRDPAGEGQPTEPLPLAHGTAETRA